MDLRLGNCEEILAGLDADSVDSIVTDPPYGLKFMGKSWDYDLPSIEIWKEIFRVLKPGGHLLSFGGTRTYHRMASRVEDAGFEIRDQLQWLFGQGFPKSHDISIDKQAGAAREVIGTIKGPGTEKMQVLQGAQQRFSHERPLTSNESLTPEAKQWDGWGTALKPANEPILLARKPLSEKTVAANVEKWGTGGINVDGSRIGFANNADRKKSARPGHSESDGAESMFLGKAQVMHGEQNALGRFPSNLLLDEEAARMLDEQSGILSKPGNKKPAEISAHKGFEGKAFAIRARSVELNKGDSGGASRFFYVAKASKRERGEGNVHPTVKPVKLMEYLVRLITPPNGIVLDPFMGSGTTGIAAKNLGFRFLGIEKDVQYMEIAQARILTSPMLRSEDGS